MVSMQLPFTLSIVLVIAFHALRFLRYCLSHDHVIIFHASHVTLSLHSLFSESIMLDIAYCIMGVLRTMTAVITLMIFNFYRIAMSKCPKKFCTVFRVKYGGATYTRLRLILE